MIEREKEQKKKRNIQAHLQLKHFAFKDTIIGKKTLGKVCHENRCCKSGNQKIKDNEVALTEFEKETLTGETEKVQEIIKNLINH